MEKHYDFARIEQQMQTLWETENIYRFDPGAPGDLFAIDTPPPTISGKLHIGHLFSYTQAEIIARFRRMQGAKVFYPFGFDNNGLPTERLVEREMGVRAHTLPRDTFIAQCESTIAQYEKQYRLFWQSLGFSTDWALRYQTISPDAAAIAQASFLELVQMGKAYRKASPVLWCSECQTSIAQAELDTAETEGVFYYLPFKVGAQWLEVATTRPELLYGCVSLFIHPNDERFKHFIGKTAQVPLYHYAIPILADEKADPAKGTGIVMCATFGDSTDAEWYSQHQLPFRQTLMPDGTLAADVPYVGGLSVSEARAEMVRRLQTHHLLRRTAPVSHTTGIHERCGKPVEIMLSKQWYIDVLSHRDEWLRIADEINWYPAKMKGRYIEWVNQLKWDWCISRQRYFGVPFPVWYCNDCGTPVFAKPEQLPLNPLKMPYTGTCTCGCTAFSPEYAVFDTWAVSGLTPQINARNGQLHTPMHMRTHAHDIIRTWTFYTIVRSFYHTGKRPWNDVMICGFVLPKKGEKYSKSKANSTVSPESLIATHSADALRYWTAGAGLGTDTLFNEEEIRTARRFITKLWNAAKFSDKHIRDVTVSAMPELLPIDCWIIAKADETTRLAAQRLYAYDTGAARRLMDDFFWKDFCDYYIEIIKERLYEPEKHSTAARDSARFALYYALLSVLKGYAIFVPHVTEYIYQQCFRAREKKVSIHQLRWAKPERADAARLCFGEQVKAAIFAARKYKAERHLSMRAPMDATLTIEAAPNTQAWIAQTERDIIACTRAQQLEIILPPSL